MGDFGSADLLGVIGALVLCGGYFAVVRRLLDPHGLPYNLANLVGAALLLISVWLGTRLGATVIAALWLAIACMAVVQLLRRRGD